MSVRSRHGVGAFMTELRIGAFVAFLTAWAVVIASVVVNSLPRRGDGQTATSQSGAASPLPGMALQAFAMVIACATMRRGPVAAGVAALWAVLLLAPASALLFAACVWMGRRAAVGSLVTTGPYRWVRHPLYVALLGMLLATGFLVTPPVALVVAVVVYGVGTELRAVAEEEELRERLGEEFEAYRRVTRARYVPGVW